ncbi:MAG: hypothetical protein Q4B26_00980 [Eubacteriales bacterium]|nr:hypothetical protein [Eubacteriales bacterium]
MKGFKALKNGTICKGKKYEENIVLDKETEGLDICEMDFFKDPLDVLNYHFLLGDNGDFTEIVEAETDDNDIVSIDMDIIHTRKMKIGRKLSFEEFMEASINSLLKESGELRNLEKNPLNEDSNRIGSSDDDNLIRSIAESARIGSSGNGTEIISYGDFARIISSGGSVNITSAGMNSVIGSTGNGALIINAGHYVRIGSSGNNTTVNSSGRNVMINSTGKNAKVNSSGYHAKITCSGNYAWVNSIGDDARIRSVGNQSVISCVGNNSAVSAKKGSWITFSKWKNIDGEKMPICVKTEYVDGVRIKEDVFYTLRDGEFVEVMD